MKKWTKKLKVTLCSIGTSLILIGLLGSMLPKLPADTDSGCSVLSCDGKEKQGKPSPLEEMDELY